MPVAEPTPPRRFHPWDVFWLAVFLFYWILPVAYHGLSQGKRMPGTPAWMRHLTNVSCLFTHATWAWPSEYVEVLPANSQEWVEFPEPEYSTMFIFGNRSRLSEIHRRGLERNAYAELAQWLAQRYQERHPGPRPTALRLIRAHDITAREVPHGHWRVPPLESVPPSERSVIFTFYPRSTTAVSP